MNNTNSKIDSSSGASKTGDNLTIGFEFEMAKFLLPELGEIGHFQGEQNMLVNGVVNNTPLFFLNCSDLVWTEQHNGKFILTSCTGMKSHVCSSDNQNIFGLTTDNVNKIKFDHVNDGFTERLEFESKIFNMNDSDILNQIYQYSDGISLILKLLKDNKDAVVTLYRKMYKKYKTAVLAYYRGGGGAIDYWINSYNRKIKLMKKTLSGDTFNGTLQMTFGMPLNMYIPFITIDYKATSVLLNLCNVFYNEVVENQGFFNSSQVSNNLRNFLVLVYGYIAQFTYNQKLAPNWTLSDSNTGMKGVPIYMIRNKFSDIYNHLLSDVDKEIFGFIWQKLFDATLTFLTDYDYTVSVTNNVITSVQKEDKPVLTIPLINLSLSTILDDFALDDKQFPLEKHPQNINLPKKKWGVIKPSQLKYDVLACNWFYSIMNPSNRSFIYSRYYNTLQHYFPVRYDKLRKPEKYKKQGDIMSPPIGYDRSSSTVGGGAYAMGAYNTTDQIIFECRGCAGSHTIKADQIKTKAKHYVNILAYISDRSTPSEHTTSGGRSTRRSTRSQSMNHAKYC